MDFSRRGFLSALSAALVVAPAVVHARNIMPISSAKLWLPPQIGTIKPIVGKIPDGWVVCDGRWLITTDFAKLHTKITDDYGVAPGGAFLVPDLMQQAAQDRAAGKEVGRYVIYAGDDAVKRSTDLASICFETRADTFNPDIYKTMSWPEGAST